MKKITIRLSDLDFNRFNKLYEQSTDKSKNDFMSTLIDTYIRKEGILMDNVFKPVTSQRQEFDYASYQKDLKREHQNYINEMLLDISETGDVKQLVRNMVALPKLSIDNLLALTKQRPDLTIRELKSFSDWNKEGVNIKKDEKSLSMMKYEGEYKRQSGEMAKSYAVKKVFDISQTTKDFKPTVNVMDNIEIRDAIVRMLSPVKVEAVSTPEANTAFMYEKEEKILIATNPKATSYEIIKELLIITFTVKLPVSEERAVEEVPQQQLAIHMILEGYGFRDNFPVGVQKYLKGKEPDVIKDWLNESKKLSNDFIKGVDLCHEANIKGKEILKDYEKTNMERHANKAIQENKQNMILEHEIER